MNGINSFKNKEFNLEIEGLLKKFGEKSITNIFSVNKKNEDKNEELEKI